MRLWGEALCRADAPNPLVALEAKCDINDYILLQVCPVLGSLCRLFARANFPGLQCAMQQLLARWSRSRCRVSNLPFYLLIVSILSQCMQVLWVQKMTFIVSVYTLCRPTLLIPSSITYTSYITHKFHHILSICFSSTLLYYFVSFTMYRMTSSNHPLPASSITNIQTNEPLNMDP